MNVLRTPRDSNLCGTGGPDVHRLEPWNEAKHGKDAVREPPRIQAALLIRNLIEQLTRIREVLVPRGAKCVLRPILLFRLVPYGFGFAGWRCSGPIIQGLTKRDEQHA